ncbi:protein kinase domain-containing protein [Rhodococcus sp. NPDC003322]
MVEDDPFRTQADVEPAVVAELAVAGFEDADEIGRGGFGVVYRCAQVGLDRTVAVKVLSAEPNEENRARFLREQRAMGRLTGHPNIVGVLQVGQTDSGHPFLVMQYHNEGSLDARIRTAGPLPLDEVLQLGVKLAGALDTAHELGIVHRDVKPANILFTDYGEPALADFGIAHIAGGFRTATGTITGSPAFTAPEILGGDSPTPASDVYGLGATLFCALTGHAAFERRSGEQVIAQFLRITTAPVPNLRESGFPDGICAVIESAMARDPQKRPNPTALGDELRRIQRGHRPPVEDVAPRTGPGGENQAVAPAGVDATAAGVGERSPAIRGNLPADLTSFVGREAELSQVQDALSAARLVTLSGVGGVGKTRLALRAAATVQRNFSDGVWLVELDELRDPALVIERVAAVVGVRDRSTRALCEVLADTLAPRMILLVLDNCEQLVEAVADLARTLLPRCPALRILATSREPLGVGGESVLRVPPLTVPSPDRAPSQHDVSRFDAVTLFAERAAAAVPGFELTDGNRDTVARICVRLDGLPLAIELAAARIRALSPEQILQRLSDRYALLTRGSRGAPTRQQTLRWSVAWSYELCTPAEQQLWGQLSVFTGGVDLDAAEYVCGDEVDVLDTVTALVDKSILIREESNGAVRFRMLETLRDYGRATIEHTDRYQDLRRRHRDWYERLALAADAEWFSPRQLDWALRLERELPNLREALEFGLPEESGSALRIAAGLAYFWVTQGLLSEGRRWIDRALPQSGSTPTELARAVYVACGLAVFQSDLAAATDLVEEGRILDTGKPDPMVHAFVAAADGWAALAGGDLDRARTCLEDAVDIFGKNHALSEWVEMLVILGWTYQSSGQTSRARVNYEQALSIAESHGESMHRSYALWSMGIVVWIEGDRDSAAHHLKQGLRLARLLDDPLMASAILQALAWVAGDREPGRAAVLMGAADALYLSVDRASVLFPNVLVYGEQSERNVRRKLGERAFETAYHEGGSLDLDGAIVFALGERSH